MDIKLRKTKRCDELDILLWRNDKITRNFSLNSKLISPIEHNKWFRASLADKNTLSFIATKGDKKVGFISYQKKSDKICYVNISLEPIFRYKGLGCKILLQGQKKLTSLGFTGNFHARIKKNNISSIKSFKKANYIKKKEYKDYLLFCNTNISRTKNKKNGILIEI